MFQYIGWQILFIHWFNGTGCLKAFEVPFAFLKFYPVSPSQITVHRLYLGTYHNLLVYYHFKLTFF